MDLQYKYFEYWDNVFRPVLNKTLETDRVNEDTYVLQPNIVTYIIW